MAVHLIQLLCERRHAILACAYDPAQQAPPHVLAAFQATVKRLLDSKILGRACFMCGGTVWNYEDKPTPFATLEEAGPVLLDTERRALRTRFAVKAMSN